MNRREFLQALAVAAVSGLAIRLGWPIHAATAGDETGAPSNSSNKPLMAIPFPIYAKGTPTQSPPIYKTYFPSVNA